jgi:hypothetical protein
MPGLFIVAGYCRFSAADFTRLLPTGRVLMLLSGRNAGIDCAFAGLSAHSGHTLLIGSERAIAKTVVCYGAGAPWIVAGHGRRSGGDDKQSGKSEE